MHLERQRKMIKLAGIVTIYNPDEFVVSNIETYIETLGELYVVDNSSTDQFYNQIKHLEKVIYLPNFQNLGVATALNIGAKKAIERGYEWLLTMDQDSNFNKNSIAKISEFIEANPKLNIGLVSPWHDIKTGVQKPTEDVEELIEVMTSGNVINLKAYQAIGGFKDWLFIDGIDIEYCMNLNRNGYKVVRLNNVILHHELGDVKIKRVLGRNFVCSNHNRIRRYYMVRNTYYICDMYKDVFPEYCQFIKNGLKGAARNIIVFEHDKYKKIRNMYRGYKDYKKNIKGIYKYKS